MLRTFNCGVGFVLFAKKNNFQKIVNKFPKSFKPYIIGKIVSETSSKVIFEGNINFKNN